MLRAKDKATPRSQVTSDMDPDGSKPGTNPDVPMGVAAGADGIGRVRTSCVYLFLQ